MQKQYEQKKVSTALIQELGGLFFIVLVIYYSFRSYKKGFRRPESGSSRNPRFYSVRVDVCVLQLQHVFKCLFIQHAADIEGAEFTVTGTDFIKTHFVD